MTANMGKISIRKPLTALFLLSLGVVNAARAEEALPPAAGPRTLPELINLGLEKQPALAAARADLAAAQTGQQAVAGIKFGRLLAPDLPVRKQQACLGVSIAASGLEQAEWETRYAVIRNYYSVIYARQQLKVVVGVTGKLERAYVRGEELLKLGDEKLKINRIDLDVMKLQIQLLKSKEAEVSTGIQKAFAALREALGVGLEFPLEIGDDAMPALVKEFNKEELIAHALANRGEMSQVSNAYEVTRLEINAQARNLCAPKVDTFARGADIHVKPIPQGTSNGDYRPGAIGPEMPSMLVGHRKLRMQRVSELTDRAAAVVDKTTNLITLEVEATYLKWLEAAQKVQNLATAPEDARKIAQKVQDRFNDGNVSGEELMRARTLEDQVQAQYNEAVYLHALGLAALERVTAGGYRITKQP